MKDSNMSEAIMKHVKMDAKLIRFTGDYSKLKNMGFVFQKLYASNYMQWSHEDAGIRIWKAGKDLTISRVGSMEGQLLQLLIDRVPLYARGDVDDPNTPVFMYSNRLTNELTFDDTEMVEQRKALYNLKSADDITSRHSLWRTEDVTVSTIRVLRDLHKLGWIHVVDAKIEHYTPIDLN
jgi:hypothetical protein